MYIILFLMSFLCLDLCFPFGIVCIATEHQANDHILPFLIAKNMFPNCIYVVSLSVYLFRFFLRDMSNAGVN